MSGVFLETLSLAGIYGLLSLSLNLQYGLTGLLNFGQGFLFAVGGYTVGVAYFHHWPSWIGIAAAPFVGALGGVLLAIPSKRLTEDYWALMTLAVGELFLAIMTNEDWIAGGSLGTYGIPRLDASRMVPILAVLIAVIIVGFERIRRSQFGRLLRVLREDEVLLAAIGRDAFVLRLKVMAIGGAVAAMAGVAIAFWLTLVAPDVFSLDQTLIVWAMLIVGGRGNNYGAILGALVIQGIFLGTRYVPDFAFFASERAALLRILIVGLAIVLMLMFRREGTLPERKVRYVARGQ